MKISIRPPREGEGMCVFTATSAAVRVPFSYAVCADEVLIEVKSGLGAAIQFAKTFEPDVSKIVMEIPSAKN